MPVTKITNAEIAKFCNDFFEQSEKTMWPTTKEIAENFGVSLQTIVRHVQTDDRFMINRFMINVATRAGCGGMSELPQHEWTVETMEW